EALARQVGGHGLEHFEHQRDLHVHAADEAAVGEAAVADQAPIVARVPLAASCQWYAGRQHGAQTAFGVPDQQRVVTEAVGVVVHVAALQQERSVLAGGDEGVPRRRVGRGIALNDHGRSALQHGDAEAGRAVAVAVVKHQPPAVDVDHGRVADHLAVPAGLRAGDADLVVLADPGQAVGRFGVADPVGSRPGTDGVPHAVTVGVAHDPGPADAE